MMKDGWNVVQRDLRRFEEPPTGKFDWTYRRVTEGDMHGNALRFMDACHMHRIWVVSKEDYEQFATIYETHNQSNVTIHGSVSRTLCLDEVQKIIARTQVVPGAKVRFIGDLLADRGANDIYTLLMLEKLIDSGADVEIIMSNHDRVFMAWMEATIAGDQEAIQRAKGMLKPEQCRSLQRLSKLLNGGGGLPLERLKEIYEKYKQKVKLISYDYDDSGRLFLHSHAHIDERDLPQILHGLLRGANRLDLQIGDVKRNEMLSLLNAVAAGRGPISIEDTIRLIDCINLIYTQAIQENKMDALERLEPIPTARQVQGYGYDPLVSPIAYTTWNRDDIDAREALRPKNPNIINVHGHHQYTRLTPLQLQETVDQQHAVSLDGPYAKSMDENHCLGVLTCICSRTVRTVPRVTMRHAQDILELIAYLESTRNLNELNGELMSPDVNHQTLNDVCSILKSVADLKKLCGEVVSERSFEGSVVEDAWKRLDQRMSQSVAGPWKSIQRMMTDRATARHCGQDPTAPSATTSSLLNKWNEIKMAKPEQSLHVST